MFEEYFDPITATATDNGFGSSLDAYRTSFPDLDDKRVALIGMNNDTSTCSDRIREQLYQLAPNGVMQSGMVDLGNLRQGATRTDQYAALRSVTAHLIERGIIPVIFGPDIDSTEALYESFAGLSDNIETSFISSRLPLLEGDLLDRILKFEPHHLFRLNAIGFQGHFMAPKTLDVMQNLNFGHLRLGALKNRIDEAELLLRNTHLTVAHLDVVRFADAPGVSNPSPIGVDGDMACQLAWYSGVSDTTQVFGLFGYDPDLDLREQTAMLSAQMLWYFIDGIANRKADHPSLHSEFMHYRCGFTNHPSDVLFHKSKRTNRWWMEIPHPKSLNNSDRNVIIPCSYDDYQLATQGELPDRYLNALQLLH